MPLASIDQSDQNFGASTRQKRRTSVRSSLTVWANPKSAAALLPKLKSEGPHQHGRLYAPSADGAVQAAMVTTDYMKSSPPSGGPRLPLVRAIPTDTSDFKYGCWLSQADVQIARDLGVPGF